MWTCSRCEKELDSSIAWDCFPPDYKKICLHCKWFQHETTADKLEFSLWCPYCTERAPCELHAEACANMKTVEFLKQVRFDADKPMDAPVTDDEDLIAERMKQKSLRQYRKERESSSANVLASSSIKTKED